MNAQDLLDYHLGQMDDRRRDQFEGDLERDPELGRASRQFGANLGMILDDGLGDLDPPAGLATRTIALVDNQRRKRGLSDLGPVRVPFRWADVAVAAGIFLAGLLTLLPAMHRSRTDMQQASCMYNLQQVGLGLATYATTHGHYPHPPSGYPAGFYGVQLSDAHSVHDPSILSCPCRGASAALAKIPCSDEFGSMMDRSPADCQRLLADEYAYNAGFHRAAGQVAPVPADLANAAPLPLLADQPPLDDFSAVLEGNSPDHGGGGQNVLFTDHSVRWLRSRKYAADDDIYLNQSQKPAPGLHLQDVSLIPGGFTMPAE
jgi:hypothetical protein